MIYILEPKRTMPLGYRNPLFCQVIASELSTFLDYGSEFRLVDLNTSHEPKLDDAKLYIVNTPEGCSTKIEEAFSKLGCDNSVDILFVGETITDGLTENFLRSTRTGARQFSFPGRDEKGIVSLVLKRDRFQSSLESLSYINSNDVFMPGTNAELESFVGSVAPLFTDEIYEEFAKSGQQIYLEAFSRGCEFKCSFCHLNNQPLTSRVVQDVGHDTAKIIAKIRSRLGYWPAIQFTDENFFGGKTLLEKNKRLDRVIALSEKLAAMGFNGRIGIDTRSDSLMNPNESPQMSEKRFGALKAFSENGLDYIYLGVESFTQSQINRYKKGFTNESTLRAIGILEKLEIPFTIGLINFDPLVTIEEIENNISFVEDHGVQYHVASLLKEMRLHARSSYLRKNGTKSANFGNSDNKNYLFSDRDSVDYISDRVKQVAEASRIVHKLFSNHGYRHSDIAYFLPQLPDDIEKNLRDLPSEVIEFEIEILRFLITDSGRSYENREQLVIEKCEKFVNKTLTKYGHIFNLENLSDNYSSKFLSYLELVFIGMKQVIENTDVGAAAI